MSFIEYRRRGPLLIALTDTALRRTFTVRLRFWRRGPAIIVNKYKDGRQPRYSAKFIRRWG